MVTALIPGRRAWEGGRDDEGHRTYMITHLVGCTEAGDGPTNALVTAGLPAVGSAWIVGNDNDTWAFCYPYMKISAHELKEGEWVKVWRVEQKFSTKPLNRCGTATIESPLDEPMKISGSFSKYSKEAVLDRFGNPIRTSSHERFSGPTVEFDANRPSVRIEQNVLNLELATFSQMIDTVNDASLWGLSSRRIKLSTASWERKLYGTCTYYYTRSFEFDVDYNGWDRRIVDEGHKVLNGHWDKESGEWTLDNIAGEPPDRFNPNHFKRATDRAGNFIKVPLDGYGKPLSASGTGSSTSDLHTFLLEYYQESNFLTLGIPITL